MKTIVPCSTGAKRPSVKLITSLLAAVAVVHTASAVSIISFEPNVSGAPADVTFEGFPDGPQAPFTILPGVTLGYDGAVIVQSIGNGDGAIPFPLGNGDYLSVKAGGTATFSLAPANQTFGFQWGSIDEYNTIEFFLLGVSQNAFTGAQVVSSPVAANGNQGLNGSAYVTFGGTFDKVVLTSSQNSFEIDNVRVPEGGMTVAMLGLAMGGMALARRKMAGKA